MSQLHFHDSTIADAREFLNDYRILLNKDAKRITDHLGPQAKRICRYCGGKRPEVKFQAKAHVFPEVFGKSCDLLSDSECDTCNLRHGRYESELSNYLAVSRALRGDISRSNKPLKFNSESILIEKGSVLSEHEDQDVVTILDKAGQVISLNPDKNEIEFDCVGKSYRPINVYKSFLKVALGVLPFEEALQYRYLTAFMVNDQDDVLGKLARVNITYSEQYVEIPHVIIFRRKLINNRAILDIAQLSFKNIIVSFPLPFHNFDIQNKLYNNDLDITVPPPLFQRDLAEGFWFYNELKDFSSTDLIAENINFKMRFNYREYEQFMKQKYPKFENLNMEDFRIGALVFKPNN